MAIRRIRLDVSYDGTGFSGSQIQPKARTVAGTLKVGLEELLNHEVHLLMAGRTDAGVHAEQNVCCFDAELPFPTDRLAGILNGRLPADLLVRTAVEVDDDFHPRFDAHRRTYHYRLYHGADCPVASWRYVLPVTERWDQELCAAGLALFTGRHCFRNFSRGCEDGDDAVCEVTRAEQVKRNDRETVIVFTANRFLRNMICRMVGALLDLNSGVITGEQIRDSISGDLSFKPKPAPPQGLTLMKVDYPEKE